jgi:hypothetical protein
MTQREQQLEAMIVAMEPVLGLQIETAWRPQVLGFLKMAADAADLVLNVPLDDRRDESASVFRPGVRSEVNSEGPAS